MTEAYIDGLADEIAEKVAARLEARGDDRPLLTVDDLAKRLGISESGARNLVHSRDGKPPAIPSVVIGEGSRRIYPREVDRYIASRALAHGEGDTT